MVDTYGYEAVEDHGYEPVAVHGYEEAPQTKLLSSEGVASIAGGIVPSIKQGMLGLKLFKQENPDPVMSMKIGDAPVNPLHAAATPEDIAQTQSELQANKKEIQANTPANPSYPLQIATGATQSIAQNVPALAASVATKNPLPMLSSAMAQTKGQSYAEDRTENSFGYVPVSQDNAVANAGVKAGIEGALETVPAVGLLKDLTKTAVNAAGQEVKQSFAKTAGKFLLREQATEIPTSILQDTSHRVFAEPNKPFDQFAQETLSHAIDTAVTTPFAAGGTVAIAQAQQMAQEKIGALIQRKDASEAQTLAGAKADLLADLDKRAQEAAAGIPLEDSVAARMAAGNAHADIPTTPLTPEEEDLAKVQLANMKSGANAVPPNPVAQADTADFDQLLSDPIYQQPEQTAAKKEAQIQYDMDRGMSAEVAQRRAMNEFPNALPPTQRPIAWSTNPAHIGLNLTQAALAPDDVVVLGGNEQQFSPAYTQALGQTISSWARTIMPEGSRIVLNLSGLNGEAVGGYQQSASGIHILTPRELVRTTRGENQTPEGVTLGTEPGTGYNTFTQQQTFGAITHEFGHALIMSTFAQAMPPAYKDIVSQLDAGGRYSDEQIAQMPAPEAAVVAEYQAMKHRVMDGTMSAEQLVENWLGTWKLGKDLMKQHGKSLYSFAQEVLTRDAKLTGDPRLSSTPLSQIPAYKLVHAMGRNLNVSPEQSNAAAENYYLSFNEYMAEQFSRYAHANKIDQGTPLGVYFKRALDSLRNFFKALKTTKGVSGETAIKPGVSFQAWVDGMGMAKALRMAEKAKPKSSRRPALRKPKAVPDVEDLPQEISKAEKVKEEAAGEGVAVDELEALAEDPVVKEELKARIRQMLPDPADKDRAELMQLVARGQLLDAEDQLLDIIAERTKVKRDIAPGDAQEIDTALKRVGITNTSLWTRAINFFKDAQQYLMQMQQISHTTDDAGAVAFVLNQNKLMAMKNNMLKDGTEIAKQWEGLSRADATLLEKILMDEFYSGGHATELKQDPVTGKWAHTAGIGFVDYTKQHGLDITTPEGEALGKLILGIKNSMLDHIQIIEDMAIQQVKDKYRQAPLILQKRANEIRALAEKWRRVPFVPQSHYGNYVVKTFERDESGKKVLASKTHFETAAEQDAAVAKLLKTTDKENVKWFKISEQTGVQLTLPTDFLQTLEDTGEFTSDQLASIGEAMTPLRDEKAFSKFARDASKVTGASNDILRNYANWIEDNANFVSKLTFGRQMTKARAWTRSDMTDMKNSGDIQGARDKQRLLDTMTKTQQFIMHPMDEYFRTRSAVSLSFLMYAPKTALMNATGLFQTWAAVTADYGEFAGNKIMAKATKDLISGNLTADEQWMKNKALEDGIIDQGFGYFMSGLANAGNLARRVRPTMLGKGARMFVDLGMFPFKAIETGNRNLTMLSIYRAERTRFMGQGLSVDEARNKAYFSASSKTRLLQNDYASGNRPEILRGKKSLFMIFLSYPQYMLWVMSGGYERGTRAERRNQGETPRSVMKGMTMRMWLVFLALSGIEGVPFGETILELLQRMWILAGKGENIRVEGQRFLKETAGIESMYWRNVIQRGFFHDVLGADLSGSYSLGKPLPGLGLINPQAENWKEFVGEAFADLSGPFGGVVKGTAGLGLADNVGVKEMGSNLPGAAGSIARAISASTNGVKSSRGERILRDEQGNLREPTTGEIAAIGAGFRLSDVAQFQQLEALKRQQADYWNGRRLGLKKSYLRAVEDRDPKVREDVLKAVDEYNSEAPDRGLRLTGKELREFTRNTEKGIRRLEQDRDPQRVRGLNRDISSVMQEKGNNPSGLGIQGTQPGN